MKPDIRKASELLEKIAKRNTDELSYYLAAAVLAYHPIRESTLPQELEPLLEETRRKKFDPHFIATGHRPINPDDEYVLKVMAKLMLQEYISKPKVWLDEAVTATLGKGEGVMPIAVAAREALRLKPDDYLPSSARHLAVKFRKDKEYYTLWAADEIFEETVLKTREKRLY